VLLEDSLPFLRNIKLDVSPLVSNDALLFKISLSDRLGLSGRCGPSRFGELRLRLLSVNVDRRLLARGVASEVPVANVNSELLVTAESDPILILFKRYFCARSL